MKNKIFKKENLIYIILIIFSIFIGVILRAKLSNIYSLNSDMIEHYYHMRKYYDNKEIPVTGAYLAGGVYIADEYNSNSEVFDESIPNIPGGYFYIEYMIYYFLGGENLYKARILYFVAMALFCFIFLFWIYKTFGIKILSIIASLIFVNITFLTIGNRFYNPHTAFILSFISIPIIMQYTVNKDNIYIYIYIAF